MMHSHSHGHGAAGTGGWVMPGRLPPPPDRPPPTHLPAPPSSHPIPPPRRRLWLVLGITFAFMVVEVVGGWLAGSLALLADAAHMLTDVGALGLVLLTAWISRRPADDSKTYGYLRWEILAALVNGAFLFGIAAFVVIEAVSRIRHPEPIRAGLFLGGGHRRSSRQRGFALPAPRRPGAQPQHPGRLSPRAGRPAGVRWARSPRRSSSGSPGGRWPTRCSRSCSPCSSWAGPGGWSARAPTSCSRRCPATCSCAEVQRRILSVPGVAAVHDLHVWTVTSGMVAMSGHAVVPVLAEHPRVLAGSARSWPGWGSGM